MVEKPNNESLTLGVDLGGTKVETSLVDTTGHILASHRCPTQPERGPDGVIGAAVPARYRLQQTQSEMRRRT